jgi:serine/threonine protein kinase
MPDKKTYPHALQPGHKLLWYRIREVLGQGSFGITYLCQDLNHHRLVAIKEYAPEYFARREDGRRMVPGSDTDASDFVRGLERFVHEAETLDRFQHPNIVRVMDVFETNNTAYMIMDYEWGESLGSVLTRQKTLSDLELCGLLLPVLDGLEAIHRAGMVHGDLKPSTIYIRTDGSPVLLDFGCARQAIGTLASPGYAPIEQYIQGKPGPWTDLYGLGATGYRAVVGSAPIDAVARAEAIQAEAPDPYEPLGGRTKAPYSQALLKGIDHALAFESTRRPQTVNEWREDLKLDATHTWAIKVKDSSRASVDLEDAPTLPSTRQRGSVVNLGQDRGGDAVSSPHSSGVTEEIPAATAGHVSRWLDRNVALGMVTAFAGVGLMFVLVADNSDPATRTDRDIAYTLPTQQPAVVSSKQTTRKPRHTRPGQPSSAVQVPKPQLLAGGQPVANATPIPVSTDTPSSAVDAKESVIRDRSEGEPPRVHELPSALSSPVQGQADPPAVVDPPGAGQPQSQVSQDGRLPRVSDPQATDETKPSGQRTAQIAQLLAQAGRDVAALRLTVPASRNAFAKYREVLVLDPESSQALDGIASIVDKYVQLIDRAIETDRFRLADLYLRRAVTVSPEDRNLRRARKTMVAKRYPRGAEAASRRQ